MIALEKLLPLVQYFAYVEIENLYYANSLNTELWDTYDPLREKYSHLAMRSVTEVKDIWLVFRELFAKQEAR